MKKEERIGYLTPKTKKRITVPVTVFCASPAVTSIVVFPKPKTRSFTVIDAPAARDAIISFCKRPMKIRPPVNLIFHWILVIVEEPVFLITAETPKPPRKHLQSLRVQRYQLTLRKL
jgi:hypothetical protein